MAGTGNGALYVWNVCKLDEQCNNLTQEIAQKDTLWSKFCESVPTPHASVQLILTFLMDDIFANYKLQWSLINPERGEFELPEQYSQRMIRAKQYVCELWQDYAHRAEELVTHTYLLPSCKLKPDFLQTIGRYNIDKRFFPVTIAGESFELYIPLEDAPSFKENWKNALVWSVNGIRWDGFTGLLGYIVEHPREKGIL